MVYKISFLLVPSLGGLVSTYCLMRLYVAKSVLRPVSLGRFIDLSGFMVFIWVLDNFSSASDT
jgi:hypothetical protein